MSGAALAVVSSACTQSDAPAPKETKKAVEPAAKPASAPTTDKRSLHKHMQEHFVKADDLKEAIIAGKVEQAQALAKWLVEHPPPADLPASYTPHVERLKGAAQKIVDAGGASEAAHGAAELAAACAQCHLSRGKEIEFGADPEPAAGDDLVKSHMARHAWAVTRMWDGVVGGSNDLYKTGAKVLSELPTFAMSLKDGNKLAGAAADQIVTQLEASAEKGAEASTPEARAEVLGAVLSSCGNCHAMIASGQK